MSKIVKKVTNEQTHNPKMNTYLFNGTIVYTEYVTVEIECETLEEAQKRIDDENYDISSGSGFEDRNLVYVRMLNDDEK